ncbi:cell division protein ZauP [soil metagenome]
MTPGEGNALELAARRLERAVAQLEHKLAAERAARPAVSVDAPAGLFDTDAEVKAEKLAAELETARARERALEEAGEQASEALGRAIAEIRAALGDETLITEGVHDEDEEDALEDQGGDLFGTPLHRPEREA